MNFATLINAKVMPDVNNDYDEPVIIYRDRHGDWHGDHTQNQYGEEFDWVEDIKEQDPLAFITTGKDYAKGSYLYVYDKIVAERLRIEYELFHNDGTNAGEPYTLISFMEDNIGEFSDEATDYLMELERPFAAINEMIPQHLKRNISGSFIDEKTQDEIIDCIENNVEERLKNREKGKGETQTEKSDIDGYEEKLGIKLGGKYIVFAENKNEDGLYLVCNITNNNAFGLEERSDIFYADYLEGLREFTARVDTTVENLNKQRSENGLPFQTLTAENCIPNSALDNYNDKLIVIKPEALAPEYRSAEFQLQYCTGGNGADPNARGSAVFCKDFYSGQESRFERIDVAGVADVLNMPVWVDQKIALEESFKEPGVFEYGGYHFKPYRKFQKSEVERRLEGDSRPWKTDAAYAMRNMSTDFILGLSKYDWKKEGTNYSHEGFYSASGDSDADIFKCIENGRLYVPHENELFQYSEPSQKSKEKKPSLTKRVENGKEKVREADKNKDKSGSPKNKKKGVDIDG